MSKQYTNQVPKQQLQLQRGQQRHKAAKKTKPREIASQRQNAQKKMPETYVDRTRPTNPGPRRPETGPGDIVGAINIVGGVMQNFLATQRGPIHRSATAARYRSRDPVASAALAALIIVNLITGTAAAVNSGARHGGLDADGPEPSREPGADAETGNAPPGNPASAAHGSAPQRSVDPPPVQGAAFSGSIRDKRSARGATRFTQEQLEDIRRRNQPPASNRNANHNPVSNLDNNPIGDLNEVKSNDPNQAHRRRLGNTHDRPVAEEYDPDRRYNWNIMEDLDMSWDLYYKMRNASNNTVYPIEKISVFMEKLIMASGSLPNLIEPVLWNMGVDPYKEMSATIGQADQPMPVSAETVTPMDLVLHFCTSKKLGYQVLGADQETIDFIERITDLEMYEYENFVTKRALKPMERGFRNRGEVDILKKLEKFGVDPEDKAILRRVTARRSGYGHPEIGTRGDVGLIQGDLGTIIDVEKDGTIQRFAIVPHLPNGLLHIPHNHQRWKTWMRTLGGNELFFRDPGALPEQLHLDIDRDEGGSSPIDTVRKAVKYTFKPIVKNTMAHMQSLIDNHSTGWEMVHMSLGLYIPYYDYVRAVINDDYKGALWILGFELVPRVGETAKRLFTMKRIYIPKSVTSRIPQKIKKVGKKLINYGEQVYENGVEGAKTANGLGMFVKRPKLRRAGARGFARVSKEESEDDE